MGNGLNTLSRGSKARPRLFHTVSCRRLPLCVRLLGQRRRKCNELLEVLDIPAGYHQVTDRKPGVGLEAAHLGLAAADLQARWDTFSR